MWQGECAATEYLVAKGRGARFRVAASCQAWHRVPTVALALLTLVIAVRRSALTKRERHQLRHHRQYPSK